MGHIDAGTTPELGPVSVNPSLKDFDFCGAPKRIIYLVWLGLAPCTAPTISTAFSHPAKPAPEKSIAFLSYHKLKKNVVLHIFITALLLLPRQNRYFGPSTLIRGSSSSLNFQIGQYSPSTFILGSGVKLILTLLLYSI
jgi:hypothetical protein